MCRSRCRKTLDELEEALISTPRFFSSEEIHDETLLDGGPARIEYVAIHSNCLGCPGAKYHVFALRDGRPIVLAFDYWNLRFDRLGANTAARFDEIVASFRFLD